MADWKLEVRPQRAPYLSENLGNHVPILAPVVNGDGHGLPVSTFGDFRSSAEQFRLKTECALVLRHCNRNCTETTL